MSLWSWSLISLLGPGNQDLLSVVLLLFLGFYVNGNSMKICVWLFPLTWNCCLYQQFVPFYRWVALHWCLFSSVAQLCMILCNPMDCSMPGLPVNHQLPEFTQTHVHWVGDAIQPSHPLSSPSLPSFDLSQHQGLSNESALPIRWPKYWNFSFNISPPSEHSGLISLRMDWLDLLAVQETLKSLLQHHSSKASILRFKLN